MSSFPPNLSKVHAVPKVKIILTSFTAIVNEITIDQAVGQDLQCVWLSNDPIMKFAFQYLPIRQCGLLWNEHRKEQLELNSAAIIFSILTSVISSQWPTVNPNLNLNP